MANPNQQHSNQQNQQPQRTEQIKPVEKSEAEQLADLEREEAAKKAERSRDREESKKDDIKRFSVDGAIQAVSSADIEKAINARVEEEVARRLSELSIQPAAKGSVEQKGDIRVRVLRVNSAHITLGNRVYNLSKINDIIYMNPSHANELGVGIGHDMGHKAWVGKL